MKYLSLILPTHEDEEEEKAILASIFYLANRQVNQTRQVRHNLHELTERITKLEENRIGFIIYLL